MNNEQTKTLIQNPKEYEAVTGEKLEMHFNLLSLPFIAKWQQDKILERLNDNPNFQVMDVRSENSKLIVTIVIVKNPFPLVLAIGGVVTLCAGFFVWASLDKVYKIVEAPGGKILSIGAIAGSIAAIIGLVILLRR